MAAHGQLHALVSNDEIVLEPQSVNAGVARQTLVLNRDTGDFSLAATPRALTTSRTCFGVLGLLNIHAGPHLLLISEAERVGSVLGPAASAAQQQPALHVVYRLRDIDTIPVLRVPNAVDARAEDDDRRYLALLRGFVQTNQLYFSYSYDLTRAAQFQDRDTAKPLHVRADERFFFNMYLSRDLILTAKREPDMAYFVLPVIRGFVQTKTVKVKTRSFHYTLITRNSRLRAGTRYHVRGIDVDGNVANFNETEQLVWFDDQSSASFVQVRGSVPLFWRQVINLKYRPQLEVDDVSQGPTLRAAKNHFDALASDYDDRAVIAVNLVDKEKYELPVGRAFADLMQALDLPNLRYIHFDFHKECKKMRYDRLAQLLDQLSDSLATMGYFARDGAGTELQRQRSVIRTNCMDCLDRTNVVQALFARHFLKQQLVQVNMLESRDRLEDQAELELVLRNIWADNADAVSTAYSGTGALKTDYTRTGKRTRQGAIQDGINSSVRYIRNNFLDGAKQDAIDLFVGNYRVTADDNDNAAPAPSGPDAAVRVRVLPLICGLSIVMLAASLALLPTAARDADTEPPALAWTIRLAYVAFWAASLALSVRSIFAHGREFVNTPRLFQPLTGQLRPRHPLQ